MTDTERIERLERMLGTLITWLHGNALRRDEIKQLLEMLQEQKPATEKM